MDCLEETFAIAFEDKVIVEEYDITKNLPLPGKSQLWVPRREEVGINN
jgi:hypothetical protein